MPSRRRRQDQSFSDEIAAKRSKTAQLRKDIPTEFSKKRCLIWFQEYTGPDDETLRPEGMEKFCEDIGVEPENIVMLVLAYKLNAKNLGFFTMEEWMKGMTEIQCDSIQKLQQRLDYLRALLNDPPQFKNIYRFAFDFARDKDQRSMDIETAKAMLSLVLGKQWSLFSYFHRFLEQAKYKVINKDQWCNILEFSRAISPDLANYDEDGACDSNYETFEEHFFKTGQGRRKGLPDIILVTEKLLLQLFCLKTEHAATWNEVFSWFKKLFPGVDITSSRLAYFVKKATKKDWTKYELASSQQVVDFDVNVPVPLLSIGLNRTILFEDPLKYERASPLTITNSVFYSLENFRSRQGLKGAFVYNWILRLGTFSDLPFDYNYSQVKRRLEKIIKTAKNFQKRQNKEAFESFLEIPVFSEGNPVPAVSDKKTSSVPIFDFEKQNSNLKYQLGQKEEEVEALRLKFEALCEEKQELTAKLSDFNKLTVENEKLRAKESESTNLITEFKRSKIYKRNCSLKKSLIENQQNNIQLKDKIQSLHKKSEHFERKLVEKDEAIQSLRKQIKSEQTLKSKYKIKMKENTAILNLIEDNETPEVKLREDKFNQFTDAVRLTYMGLMGEANISAINCSKAVQIVSKHLFNKSFSMDELPSPSTVLNFSNEAYHIAQYQIVDKINKSQHFTLATDGTSRQKKHYLERHIVLDNKCSMSLGFTEIVRDDANTLLEKTVEILDDLCQIYCLSSERETKEQIFKDIIQKLKCMMSDRASVMKCFDKKMLEYKQDLLGQDFLFCNAHFLLGLAAAAEKSSSKIESDLNKLGRDADRAFFKFSNAKEVAAFRLIRTASEVFGPRGDEKCGCREEWLAYCTLVVKKNSKFTSFRTNRFNNVFENAYALIYHHEDIILFLTKHVSHSNLKFQSIIADVKDIQLLSLIFTLSLFQINFTGPYWKLMNSTKSYGEFSYYVQKMRQSLEKWNFENFEISEMSPVFGDEFKLKGVNDSPLNTFLSKCDRPLVNKMFQQLSKDFRDVFERQLNDFLDGGVFSGELNEADQKLLNSCPLTNLTGERIFGDLDYEINKRRHASLHFRSTLNMWKRNRTIRWVEGQDKRVVRKLIVNAKKHAAKWKQRSREREALIRMKVKERIVSNKKEKDEKELKEMEKKTLALDALIDQGGLCSNKEDLDKIMTGPNSLAKLRDQIKFRKIVLGEAINYSGNTRVLYKRLCSHLGFNFDTSPTLPQKKRRRLDE